MKADNQNEETIERMLQAHIRHAAEQRLRDELGSHYRRYSRWADLRHYLVACCAIVLVLGGLWTASPAARAAATSPCSLGQRLTAIDTSEQIIHAL